VILVNSGVTASVVHPESNRATAFWLFTFTIMTKVWVSFFERIGLSNILLDFLSFNGVCSSFFIKLLPRFIPRPAFSALKASLLRVISSISSISSSSSEGTHFGSSGQCQAVHGHQHTGLRDFFSNSIPSFQAIFELLLTK
jgi:hypothetical protein